MLSFGFSCKLDLCGACCPEAMCLFLGFTRIHFSEKSRISLMCEQVLRNVDYFGAKCAVHRQYASFPGSVGAF